MCVEGGGGGSTYMFCSGHRCMAGQSGASSPDKRAFPNLSLAPFRQAEASGRRPDAAGGQATRAVASDPPESCTPLTVL